MIEKIEQLNVIIGAALILGSLLIWRDPRISLSAALGCVIISANFWVIAQLVKRMLNGGAKGWRFAIPYLLKAALLIFVIWAVIRLPIHIVAFLVGLSTIVVAILLGTVLNK